VEQRLDSKGKLCKGHHKCHDEVKSKPNVLSIGIRRDNQVLDIRKVE
jgi:hypothetical protein